MKKLFFFALLATIAFRSAAVTHTIHVADFSFTPNTINNVHPGDVITWVWDNGVHTTTSTTIPAGAQGWNANISSTSTNFSYTVGNVTGTYNFQCSIHPTLMMGSFTVVSTAGVNNTSIANVSCAPNPAVNNLHVVFGNISSQTSVTICDITGKEVVTNQYSTKEADIDVSNLPRGCYFLKAKELDGYLSVQKFEISR